MGLVQVIDMIMSLYENHFPMRFGVVLYSSKLINKIEISGGELDISAAGDDSQLENDISSLVLFAPLVSTLSTKFQSNAINDDYCMC